MGRKGIKYDSFDRRKLKMKILYVLKSSKYGGMEWHVHDLVKGMKKAGHEVFIWCPAGEMMEVYKKDGAIVEDRVVNHDIDIHYIKELVKYIKDNSIDVIHSHELKAVANSLLAGFFSKVKVSVSHTHTPISEWKINTVLKFFDIFIYSLLVNLFSSTEIALTDSKKKIKTKEGIKEKKLTVIPNGIETEKFDISQSKREEFRKEIKEKYNIPESAFVFGNIGRITKEKGHETLILAFKKFLEKKPFEKDFYLLLVGGGELEDKVKDLSMKLGLEKNVIITGKFNEEDKVKYLSAFDIFIFPTLAEGFGIVLMESLVMGLPTICSDIEVLGEVGGKHIKTFKVGDASNLADKMISEVKRMSSSESKLVDGAKEYIFENYSMNKFVSNYENLYLRLLGVKK